MKYLIILLIILFVSCNINENTKQKHLEKELNSLNLIQCDSLIKQLNKNKADTIGKINWQPTNFNECLLQLDTLLNDGLKKWIKCLPDKEFSYSVHDSFGRYLRNSWGLWGDTELTNNLFKMGILHPDDMTGIILTCYQRKLKGENINLEKELKYYQDFWIEQGINIDSILIEINK